MKFVAGLFGGLLVAIIGSILVATTLAAAPGTGGSIGAFAFFALWAISIFVALRASSAAKAWRRLLITSAVLSFLLPLAGVIFTGSFMATQVPKDGDHAGAAAAGAAIGGGLISGFLAFVGFFMGVVLLVVGLLVGRDKQIVYVPAPPVQPPSIPAPPVITP